MDTIMICPHCGLSTFITSAHVVQDWIVDGRGEYIETVDTVEVATEPDPNNIWTCTKCDREAVEVDIEDMQFLVTEIDWDVDDAEDLENLPTYVLVPEGVVDDVDDVDNDEIIIDYVTDTVGFCIKNCTISRLDE